MTGCSEAPAPAPAAPPVDTPAAVDGPAPAPAAARADDPAPADALAPVDAPAPAVAAAPEPLRFLGAEFDQDFIVEHMAVAETRQWKPVGTSSVVFRVRLRAPVMAAYKPRSRQHRAGYLAEIGAYRVARLLRLDNVPPAISRQVSMDEIRNRLHRRYTDAWGEIRRWTIWDDDLTAPGVAIYWIPEMRELGIERESTMRTWKGWLRQGAEIPAGRVALARDLSIMLCFDYLIGNWDRLSGANAQGTMDGRRLFLRDHNVAFYAPFPSHHHERVLANVRETERFSSGFVEALEGLHEAALREELANDPLQVREEILNDRQIAELMDRRDTLRSHIGALIDAFGEEAVLFFD